jgi:seipin
LSRACGRSPGLCTFPSAVVPLTERQQLLMVGQPYKVVVELELPESPHNRDTGMFMVCGELRDAEHDTVERSCRSAILHYKSFIHNVIATLIYFPFLLSGSAEEKQLISVELFSGFQEHPVSKYYWNF